VCLAVASGLKRVEGHTINHVREDGDVFGLAAKREIQAEKNVTSSWATKEYTLPRIEMTTRNPPAHTAVDEGVPI
jgi:hypothetical protein